MRKGFVIDDGEGRIEIEFVKDLGSTTAGNMIFGKFYEAKAAEPARIKIVAGDDRFKVLYFILHEILHRYEDAYMTDLEHDVLDEIARFLARTLRNSPKLVDFIARTTRRKHA